MNTVYRVTLDIHRIGSQAVIPVFQGDSGYTIIARLTESGKPYMIGEDSLAFFQAKKPDGTFLDNACRIEDNSIVYDFLTTVKDGETCQTTAAAGEMECQFKLVGSGGAILASPTFDMVVSKTVYNEEEIINSASEYTALTEYVALLEKRCREGYFDGEKGEKGEPGEGQAFYVSVTETKGVFSADKTSEEIVDAYNGGAAVFCVYTKDGGFPMVLHLRSIFSIYGSTVISFSECYESGINTLTCSKAGGKDGWNASFLGFEHDQMANRDLPNQHPIDAIEGLKDALDGKADKPSDATEVIVDNQNGEDSSLQSFVYTLPTDNTVMTVDGWGYPDHIIMNASFDEYEGWKGNDYSLQADGSSITLPDCLSEDAKAQWKAGSTIVVRYNSDIITYAVASFSDKLATKSYVDAKIQELKKLLGY